MLRPGIEPMTSRSPKRTLYQLSYRGQFFPRWGNHNARQNRTNTKQSPTILRYEKGFCVWHHKTVQKSNTTRTTAYCLDRDSERPFLDPERPVKNVTARKVRRKIMEFKHVAEPRKSNIVYVSSRH